MKVKPCGCKGKCGCELIKCASCKKEFWLSGYARLSNFIMEHKNVCSYRCNKALGQVK
jgi:dihydrodipicolinate reductase